MPENTTPSEPPSPGRSAAEVSLGTIAMALAAFSMALFAYLMN